MGEWVENEATYQFEIALEKIEELTEVNNKLRKRIFELESKTSSDTIIPNDTGRAADIFKAADKAMNKYTNNFLGKEFPRAKSKQTKRKSI